MQYAGNGKAYTYISVSALDPKALANPYSAIIACPVEVDLYNRTLTLIKDLPISNPHSVAIGKYKDLIVYGCGNATSTGFYYSIQQHARHGDQLLKLWAIQVLSSL